MSKVSPPTTQGYAFRSQYYMQITVHLDKSTTSQQVGLNTYYSIIIIDKDQLLKKRLGLEVKQLASPIYINGVDGRKQSSSYIILLLQIPAYKPKKDPVQVKIKHKIYLVRNLKPRLLVSIEIVGAKSQYIDTYSYRVDIPRATSCFFTIFIKRIRSKRTTREVRLVERSIVPPYSITLVRILFSKLLLEGGDYFF